MHAPRGNYFFAGRLSVPANVTLEGIWTSVPAHNGVRDRGMPRPTDDGTTLLVTADAGRQRPRLPHLAHQQRTEGRGRLLPEPA